MPSTAVLNVTYSGQAATDFVVRVSVTSAERGAVGSVESPVTAVPGGPVTLLFNARDAALDWTTTSKNAAFTDQVSRTGQIPEGRYRACATVLRGATRTVVSESCADFTILLPDPPQLITPVRDDIVRTQQPFFSWTPVNAPPEVGVGYRLKVVEVIGTQVPAVALSANIPVVDQVVTGTPFLLYPLEGLPLEPNKTYAWQVIATAADGQLLFRDKVASEIHVFTMASDLLGPLGPTGTLGDEAIVQPGVAVLRGLRAARVRADLASGAYLVDGPLSLVLLGLPTQPALPVQASGLRVGLRGGDAWLVGGQLRVSAPRGLLPASVSALASIRELLVSAATGVTATVQVGAPGQGAVPLDGAYQLTALGWYGRREGSSTASDGFARVGRAQLQLALRRARLDLPSGALDVGASVRLLGSATGGCDDVWARADNGVLRAAVNCRGAGAVSLASGAPTDFLVETMSGAVTADILADTVGYGVAVSGHVRLFGGNGAACHVETVLRLAPDSVERVAQVSRCDRATAVQEVAPWLRLRYEFLRLDSVRVATDGQLRWRLGFQASPELVANPAFPMPAFVNAYATNDSIVFPTLPDLLSPDAPGVLDQFRVIWRRGAHAEIARAWTSWKATDATPYAWELEGDAFFEPGVTGIVPCLSQRFRLSPTGRFRIRDGQVSWIAAEAKWNDGCVVPVAPGFNFAVYRLGGPIAIALGATAKATTLPSARGVLSGPTWPPPGATTSSSGGGSLAALAPGLMQTVDDAAAWLKQAALTIQGEHINGVLDGLGVCNLVKSIPIDARGQLMGSASLDKACDVTLGLGKLTPYTGRFLFGPPAGGSTGQSVRWIGGARISFDSTLADHDGYGKSVSATPVMTAADSARKVRLAQQDAAKDSAQKIFLATDSATLKAAAINASRDSISTIVSSLSEQADSLNAKGTSADSAAAARLDARRTVLEAQLESSSAAHDSADAAALQSLIRFNTSWADSLSKVNATADSLAKLAAKTDSTASGANTATSAVSSLTNASLPAPGNSDADNPDVEIDWNTGRVIRGKWTIKGPFVVQPIKGLGFRLRNVVLDTLGLLVDGSYPLLYLKSTDSSMTQWSGVRLNVGTRRFDAGVVTFAQGFGLETGASDTLSTAGIAKDTTDFGKTLEVIKLAANVVSTALSIGDYRVRPPTGAAAIVNGLRVDVSGKPFLDSRGLALRGESPILGQLFGSTNTTAKLVYSNDFALRDWQTVSQGTATLQVSGTPVAIWSTTGWRPAVAELVASKIPKRLALPSEAVAYLQLRDETTDALLVNVVDAGTNWRLATTTGPIALVVPALAGTGGGTPPQVRVSFDVLVDKTTLALQTGAIVASVKGVAGFDLAQGGMPFAIEELRYDRPSPTAAYRLSLAAALTLLGEASPTGRVSLTIDGNGQFAGEVTLPVARTLPLGSPQVQLQVDRLAGTFGGTVSTGLTFQIDAVGGLTLALDGQQPWTLGATLRLTPNNAQFVDVRANTAGPLRLGAPGAAFLLGNPRLPLLTYDATTKRVRFDLLFDMGVEIAALNGFAIPTLRDVHVRETGIDIPSFEIAEISSQMMTDGAFGQRAAGPIQAAGFGVRPLALRVGAVHWQFGTVPTVDIRLDAELSLAAPAAAPPYDLAAFKVRVLDLGWRENALRGSIEPVQFTDGLSTPFGAIRSAWGSFAVGTQSEAHIFVGADVRLPDVFGCAAAARTVAIAGLPGATPPKDTLELLPSGAVRGRITGFAPTCTGLLGPLAFRMLDSRVDFTAGPNVAPSVVLDGTMRVAAATGTASDSVRADGRLAVNLVTGEIIDASAEITSPFAWQPDPRNPIVNFTVQRAQLDRTALTFTGGGALRLGGGGGAAVTFDNLAYAFVEKRLVRGKATVTSNLALGAELGAAGLAWGAFPANTPRGTGPGFRLTLPSGLVIDSAGVAISGTATASLAFGDSSFVDLGVGFENGFRLATDGPVRVTTGAARFRRGAGELIATVDSTGFRPGDLFAILPIPDRLNLPSADVAYLVLGDASRRFVELATTADGRTHLRTPSGRTVDLVLPSLAYGGTAPRLQTAFDLVVEPRTMQVVGGALQVNAPAGQSLVPLQGLPIDITRVGFALGSQGWQLTAGARVRLPASISSAPITFENIVVDRTGLSGTIEAGTLTDSYRAGLPTVAQARFAGDSLVLAITGARLDLTAGQAPSVAIAGTITSAVLKNAQGAPTPLFLRGSVNTTGFAAGADLSAFGGGGIPLGVATLRPSTPSAGTAIRVHADAQRFAVEFGASIELTTLAPGLTVAVDTIHIGSDGLRVSPVSVTNGNAIQFQLFGLQFALRDSLSGSTRVYPALAGRFDGATLQLEMAGQVTAFENTSRFYGLRIGSDGTLSLAGASLINRPIAIVQDRFFLDTLRIDQGTLRAAASVSLPAPFDENALQRVSFSVAPDGRVSGAGTLVLVRENEGLATAQRKVDLGIATFHVRHLAATIDFERPRERTSVDLVSDIYIQNKQENLIRLGSVSGGTVQSGLRIAPTGVTWSGLQIVQPISVEYGPVKLTMTTITAVVGARGLSASFSGGLGLNIQNSSGGLTFRDVRFTERGEFDFGAAGFDGGFIKITEVFRLDVRNLGFSSTETTIAVPGTNTRPTGRALTTPPMLNVRVASYLSFGASVTIANTFSGGVKRVLVYQLADDKTNHILVDSLYAKVSDVFEMQASMRFDEYTDGFALQVAGSAKLMGETGVSLMGVVGNRGGTMRVGMFVAASVDITIIPGAVALTGVGGGFFINPEPDDLTLVRQVAGITGGPAARMGPPPASDFAIMLYARMAAFGAGGKYMVAGQVLVTVTDKAFRLDGNMVFLGQANELQGDIAVQVGWSPAAYLLGDVEVRIAFDSTAVGTGRLQFAVGGNAFAIKGGVKLDMIKVLTADANVIIVPSGFATDLTVTLGRTFWVVKLEAQLKGTMWFRPGTNDLGAYVEIKGVAEIPGLIGISAYLKGALIILPEVAVYAAGGGRAYVLGESVQIQFWVSISGKGFGGGLGDNPEMNAAIARASAVADELKAEADSIIRAVQNQVNNITVTPVVASDATLARVFDNAKGWASGSNWLAFLGVAFNVGSEAVYDAGLDRPAVRTPYLGTYWNLLTQKSAPSDTAAIAAIRIDAERKLANLAARRDEMLARIAALRASIDSVRAVVMPDLPNPVRNFAVGDPSIAGASTTPIAGAQRSAGTLNGVPTFDVDDAVAAQNRATMTDVRAKVTARQAEVARALGQAQASLDSVRAALSATESSSLMGYLRLWGDAVEATERQQASTVDYQMRRWRWRRDGLTFVRDSRASFRDLVDRVSNSVTARTDLTSGAKTLKFEEVANARATVIAALGQDPAFATTWQNTKASIKTLGLDQQVAAMRQQADTLAMQLYNRAADLGLAALDTTMVREVAATAATATAAVQRVRAAHAEISDRTAVVSDAQLELYGAVFDIYDAMLRELNPTDSLAIRVRARRDAIAPLLLAPQIGTAQATVEDRGYLSRGQITWTATHPAGVSEYTIVDGDALRRSLGSLGTYTTWRFSTDLAGGTQPFTAQLGARAAGGTRTTRGTPPLTFTFGRGTAAAPVATSGTALAPDATPPGVPVITAPSNLATVATDGSNVVWATRGQAVALAWQATDAESGIQEYRYRVVERDAPGTTSTVSVSPTGYTPLRTLQPVELVPWTTLGGRTTMLLTPPPPSAGKVAQVEILAVNGAGLTGFAGALVLREDATAPAAPAGTTLQLGSVRSVSLAGLTTPIVVQAVCSATPLVAAKTLALTPITAPDATTTGAFVVAKPAISDPESGISRWYALVSDVAPTAVEGDAWVALTDTAGTQFTVTGVPYERPVYVSIAARNGAGAFSTPVVTAVPARLADPTPAPAPGFCLEGSAGSAAVRFTQVSRDTESGIRGYQLRLKDAAGNVLTGFPATTSDVDVPANAEVNTTYRVPRLVFPAAGQLMVEMRAINGGNRGDLSASGLLTVDLTPPPTPLITLVGTPTLGRTGYQFKLTVSAPADPESGFAGLEVRLDDEPPLVDLRNPSVTLLPWTAVTGAVAGTGTYTIAVPSLPTSSLVLRVRSKNGTGVTSLVVRAVVPQ
ncbi:MAG: hypothetical protein K2R93_09980 [Gemmatimonadaceae bacterium]|nr:hypothetical protein [Gemmatimonadaceae bacterium]